MTSGCSDIGAVVNDHEQQRQRTGRRHRAAPAFASVRFGMCQTVACVRANAAWSYSRMALSRVLYGWEELLCDLFKLLARGKGRKYS